MEESIPDVIKSLHYQLDTFREQVDKLEGKFNDHLTKWKATEKSEDMWRTRAIKAENELHKKTLIAENELHKLEQK